MPERVLKAEAAFTISPKEFFNMITRKYSVVYLSVYGFYAVEKRRLGKLNLRNDPSGFRERKAEEAFSRAS